VKDGAFSESLQKHIIPAFTHISKLGLKKIKILDICFGLGYNTLTSIYYVYKNNLDISLEILSPELDEELVRSLYKYKYPKEFDGFISILKDISKNGFYQDDKIKINIIFNDAVLFTKNLNTKVDIIFQDAFSIKKNPELWSEEFFASLSKISHVHTILTTYTKTDVVRQNLIKNGFLLYEHKGYDVRKSMVAIKSKVDYFIPILG